MKKIEWNIEKIKVSDLCEWKKNPRDLTKKGLADLKKSIKKFGLAEPLVVNLDFTLCGGHGRKKVLEDLKIEEVDCYFPNRQLEEKEFEELNIRLNRNTAGTWNMELLLDNFEIEDLGDWGFDKEELGFDKKEESEEIKDDKNDLDKYEKIIIKCRTEDKEDLKEIIELKIKETGFLDIIIK